MLTGNSCGCDAGLGSPETTSQTPSATCGKNFFIKALLGVGALASIAVGSYMIFFGSTRPRRRARYTGRVVEAVEEGDETERLPEETMADVVFGRRR